jgi:FKBP-type peptidyl-prolyl cis-trans isomerase (trigger factor)
MATRFDYKLKEKDKNKLVYEVKTKPELFKSTYESIFKIDAERVKLPGFRPGKAPRIEIEKRIAADVLNKTINRIIPDVTLEILQTEKLNPISTAKYDIEKVNEASEVEYTFTVYVSPEIDTDKLKKIKVKYEEEKVEEKEIDDVIKSVIKSSLPKEKWSKAKEGETEEEDIQITDELVAELGYEDEKTLDGLKAKVRETLENVKKEQADKKLAEEALTQAVKVIDFYLPEEIVHEELHRREHEFIDRLTRIKLDVDAYLKTQDKTMDQIKEEWEEDIKKGVSNDIVAINLAAKEKLVPTEEQLDAEIEKFENEMVRIQYKSNEKLRDQLRTVLTRDNGVKKLIELVKGK